MNSNSQIESGFYVLSEFELTPKMILVHDPVAAGAFKSMEGIEDPSLRKHMRLRRQLII